MDNRKIFKIVKAMTSITQASLTMLIPIFGFIMLGIYLKNKFSLSPIVIAISIIIGVISGFYSMIRYLKIITKEEE